MNTLLVIAQIVVSLLLVLVLMLQVKGSSLAGFFGESQGPRFTTKRGLERLLFQTTIVLAGAFLFIWLLVVRLQ